MAGLLLVSTACDLPSTPPPTPFMPTPTVGIEAEYIRHVRVLALRVMVIMEPMSQYLGHAAYDNPSWVRDVRTLLSQFDEAYQDTLALTPSSGWEEFHSSFVLGIKHYANTASLLGEVLDLVEGGAGTVPSTFVDETIREWQLGQANIRQAARLLKEQPPVASVAAPSLPPPKPTSAATPIPQPTPTLGLDPVPSVPTEWIGVAESDGVRILLIEPTSSWKVKPTGSKETEAKIYSRVFLVIENRGNAVARVDGTWLRSVPDCVPESRKRYSFGSLMDARVSNLGAQANWLNVSGVASPTVPGVYSQKTYYREQDDIWAEQHVKEFGYYFEIFPSRWVGIFADGNWSPKVFGECVQVTFNVNGQRVAFPLPPWE